MYDTEAYKSTFAAPVYEQFTRVLPTTEDLVVDRVMSKSYITALDQSRKDTLEVEIRKVVQGADDRRWIDEKEAVFGQSPGVLTRRGHCADSRSMCRISLHNGSVYDAQAVKLLTP